jgi:hypothetical protein
MTGKLVVELAHPERKLDIQPGSSKKIVVGHAPREAAESYKGPAHPLNSFHVRQDLLYPLGIRFGRGSFGLQQAF